MSCTMQNFEWLLTSTYYPMSLNIIFKDDVDHDDDDDDDDNKLSL